jgi:hypothetical protein
MVAFLMLNTNDDAYFSHGKTSVPVKEGTMVTFPGNVVHHNVVNSGIVKLLGPFRILDMQDVAPPETIPPSAPAIIKSTKAPTIKSTKAPTIKSTKAPVTPKSGTRLRRELLQASDDEE